MTRTEALIQLAAAIATNPYTTSPQISTQAHDLLLDLENEQMKQALSLKFDPEPRGQKYGWPQSMEAIAGSLARIERHIGAGDRDTTPLPEDDDSGLSGFRIVVRDGDRQVIGDDVANLAAQCHARGAPLTCGPFDLYAFQDGEGD